MANGDVWTAIDGLRSDIKVLMKEGCAVRQADIVRITSVEESTREQGKKLDRIYYTSLVTAGGIIAFLLKAIILPMMGK